VQVSLTRWAERSSRFDLAIPGRQLEKAGIVDLTFHDLRGTAVTRLSEAECTPQEIATITGHSLRDVGAIIDRYSARTDKLAIAAIAKLERGRQ
jgi:integrase